MGFIPFTVEDREILRDLFSSNEPIPIYSFHKLYQLSPGQLSRTIRKFEALEVIEFKDNSISLSAKGRIWIIQNRSELFLRQHKQHWKEPIFGDTHLDKNFATYMPKKSLLNKSFFTEFLSLNENGLGAPDSST